MTRPYSVAFKQKMIQRLTGKNAVSASQLARQTGVRQQILSRWVADARSLPFVATDKPIVREWAVEQKARVLAEASDICCATAIAVSRGRWKRASSPEVSGSGSGIFCANCGRKTALPRGIFRGGPE